MSKFIAKGVVIPTKEEKGAYHFLLANALTPELYEIHVRYMLNLSKEGRDKMNEIGSKLETLLNGCDRGFVCSFYIHCLASTMVTDHLVRLLEEEKNERTDK